MRIYRLVLVLCCGLIFSCNTESEKNEDKRNENWCWWVDDDSGKGMWIPIKNESTVENGRYTLFYFNGNVYEKGIMQNKKKVDTTFFYNPSGKRYGYRLNLSDTDRIYYYKDGNYKIYYGNGRLNCIGIVANHREGDQWKAFYKNGKLFSEKNLKNGVGYVREYFNNGKKKALVFCDRSLPKDLYVQQWYENGQLKYNCELNNGKCHGIVKMYYENGNTESIEFMQDGVLQGEAVVAYANGKTKAILQYKDGKMNGLQKGYTENGTLLCEANMREDKPDGETRRYDILGNLTSVELYSNGKRIK
jgi:antitoxin component YwqK of YwqJK toxin-antitoxin module